MSQHIREDLPVREFLDMLNESLCFLSLIYSLVSHLETREDSTNMIYYRNYFEMLLELDFPLGNAAICPNVWVSDREWFCGADNR